MSATAPQPREVDERDRLAEAWLIARHGDASTAEWQAAYEAQGSPLTDTPEEHR